MLSHKQALEKIVKAWEVLPKGRHSGFTVEAWLKSHMKPASDNAREVLKDE